MLIDLDPQPLLHALALRLSASLGSELHPEAERPTLHAAIERELVHLWNLRGAADRRVLDAELRRGVGVEALRRAIAALDREAAT